MERRNFLKLAFGAAAGAAAFTAAAQAAPLAPQPLGDHPYAARQSGRPSGGHQQR
ncbi:hypothetical protein ACVILJ_001398 [Bradyrhizobium diazoefficiens]